MCTATWITTDTGYELFFNRDELRSRQTAEPPRLQQFRGVRFVAPTDVDAGGTWIAVNEHGLTLGLLNGAPPTVKRPGPWTSRGQLVRSLVDRDSWSEVVAGLATTDLDSFRPFTLLVLDRIATVRRATWNGVELELDTTEPQQPLASSSLDHTGAATARRELWAERFRARAESDRETHLEFARCHLPEAGPYSPCMHRDDAVTVSSCHVVVDRERVRLTYQPGPPCGEEPLLAGSPSSIDLDRNTTNPL